MGSPPFWIFPHFIQFRSAISKNKTPDKKNNNRSSKSETKDILTGWITTGGKSQKGFTVKCGWKRRRLGKKGEDPHYLGLIRSAMPVSANIWFSMLVCLLVVLDLGPMSRTVMPLPLFPPQVTPFLTGLNIHKGQYAPLNNHGPDMCVNSVQPQMQ